MILRSRLFLSLLSASILATTSPFATGQAQAGQTPGQIQKDPGPDNKSHVQPAQVAGVWRASWTGRLGVEECVLRLQQDGTKLTGTFQDLRGVMQLSGTVDEKNISFEVQFRGPRPFTTRFTGTANGDKIDGTSQAINVEGGAFLGHPGEVVNPEQKWTAKRVADQPKTVGRQGAVSPRFSIQANALAVKTPPHFGQPA